MPIKLELNDIKIIQLDILATFDSLCRQHDLRYVLAYGTLIGAIRHKGYIPWDDDIDVCMPHNDFLKLVDIVNAENNGGLISDRYRLADARINSDIPYHQTFAKIYDTKTVAKKSSLRQSIGFREGVFIDIFTIQGIPSCKAEEDRAITRLRHANDMAYYASRRCQKWELNPLYLRRCFQNLFGYIKASRRSVSQWIAQYAECVDALPDFDNSSVAYDIRSRLMDGDHFALPNNPWFPSIPWEFEGELFPVPKQYNELLSAFYGDYMLPPPAEQQYPSHDQDYYLL